MRICKYLLALTLLLFSCDMMAQQEMPFISPTATFINSAGEEEESTSYSGSAPVKAIFRANPSNIGSYYPYYEWRFYKEGEGSIEGEKEPYLIRYEEETEYTFKEAGSHRVACYASFVNGVDTIAYDDVESFTISISESKLEMPNAFSPNGDDINDTYKVKEYQSLIEFHAYIFNRWGQKLYEWDNPAADGWDGKYHGRDVKQGVYYCLVKAKGADGRKFTIRKDVNLLRGYTEKSGATGGDQ